MIKLSGLAAAQNERIDDVMLLREAEWEARYAATREPKTRERIVPDYDLIEAQIRRYMQVVDYDIDIADYRRYIQTAQIYESKRFYGGTEGPNFPEKTLEHYLAAKFLNLGPQDIYIDIASQNSPAPMIYSQKYGCKTWRQDLAYSIGINGDRIGGNAAAMPLEDGFASAMALHCSFEHFEGDADIRFIKETSRVLRPGGKAVIVPLYLASQYTINTDPAVWPAGGIDFEPDAMLYCVKNFRNRQGRFYDIAHLKSRIIDHLGDLKCTIIFIKNAKDVHPSCYVRFVMMLEKPKIVVSPPRPTYAVPAKQTNFEHLIALVDPSLASKDILNTDIAAVNHKSATDWLDALKTDVTAESSHRNIIMSDRTNSKPMVTTSVSTQPTGYFRNLNNQLLPFTCGEGTFIDPDVIIDCPERVKIGAHCVIRKGVVLRPEGGKIVIGDNCVINHYSVFHGKGGIYIGDWTIIAPNCGFYAQNHTFERFDIPITKQPNIGKGIYLMGDNWIGASAVVCDDVTIGKGAVIGANSTVTRSVPMACVAAGSPALVLKKRYADNWDFSSRERAEHQGMPQNIYDHVLKRGSLICEHISPNEHVLDVGCGEGIITAMLAEKGTRVVGTDYASDAVEAAQSRYPHIAFVVSNTTFLPFALKSFNKVVLSDVAEHLLPIQFVRTLEQVSGVLTIGGSVVVATPLTGKGKKGSTYAHIYEYSEDEMTSLLCKYFSNVRLIDRSFGLFIAQKIS
jgi:acetyltransferase-like isoleucine patch superfamily enzyme/ubiquinone/menaquinone biosynthesis C-methylase UbiE